MSRPTGQHAELLPGMPRHRPQCTPEYRREDGCWCSVTYYAREPLPTARQWRAQRRRASRIWRRFLILEKRHGLPPQHNHWRGGPGPVDCTRTCPAYRFDYARGWPPTLTSWKGLTP